VALLEFLAAAAGARIVSADVLERVAHRRLRFMVMMLAVRPVNVPGSTMTMVVAVIVIVLAVRAVDVRLGHEALP
tara:strand:+ start:141 stop:365 length:225 start_codon:yes stop_codon:yes gene_type:complete